MKFCNQCGQRLSDDEACPQCSQSDETVLLDDSQSETVVLKEEQSETVLLSENNAEVKEENGDTHQSDNLLFGRYEKVSILGKGGMGKVYLVKDLRLDGKLWALKETKMSQSDYQEFVDEARMLVTLEHPNMPNIVDYYPPDEEGMTYIIMDYVKGDTLSNLFEENKYNLPYQRIMKYSIQICNLLDYLHNHKPSPIIYRDLKPSNIMIDEKDNVQLIDFGIARKYKDGKESDTVAMGTVGFAAPEQFENKQTDHRTDLFSLGAMIFYLLSGGRYVYTTNQPLHEVNSEVPHELSNIVNKLVSTNPDDRYQSTRALKDDLTKFRVTGKLQQQPGPTKKTGKQKKQEKTFMQKVKKWAIITLMAILILLAGSTYGAYHYFTKQNDLDHTIERFEQAIINKDKTALSELMHSGDERLNINDQQVTYFLNYIENNPAHLNTLISSLKNPDVKEGEAEPLMKVEPAEKKYMLIDTYQINVTPVYMTLQTNKNQTTFYLGEKEMATSNSDEFSKNIGPLMPGLYEFRAVWQSDFAAIENKQSIELFNLPDDEEEHQLTFEFTEEYISLYSNYPDAVLYANGENTGLSMLDAGRFGPITTDGSISLYAVAEFPWGNVQSEEMTINSTDSLELEINPLTEELKKELMGIGNKLGSEYVDLYQSGSPSASKMIDESLTESLLERIKEDKKERSIWLYSLKEAQYDDESFDFQENGSKIEVSVDASFIYEGTESQDNQAESADYEMAQRLTFTYFSVEKAWKISSIDELSSINDANLITHANETEDEVTHPLQGEWNGSMMIENQEIPVKLSIIAANGTVTFKVPDEEKKEEELEEVTFRSILSFQKENGSVNLEAVDWTSNRPSNFELVHFTGSLNDGSLSGDVYREKEKVGTFTLKKQ